MAISIDWATKTINVPQADLTHITGTLYELDTDTFRLTLKALEASDYGMPNLVTHRHNTQVTVAGVTYARTVEIISGYSVTFEDGQYSVRLVGSNNNIFDIQNGILTQNQVQVIPTNSAGLIAVNTGSGVTEQDKLDIADRVWDESKDDHTTIDTFGAKNQNLVPSENIDDYKGGTVDVNYSGITAAVWDAQLSEYTLSGSAGYALGNVSAGSDPGQIADAVWDELRAEHTSVGSFGEKNQLGVPSENLDDYKATDVSVSASGIADAVWDEVLTDHNIAGTFGSKNQNLVPSENIEDYKGGTVDINYSGISDAVWDVQLSGYQIPGSAGYTLDNVSAGSDPATIADAVWDEQTAEHQIAGTTGEQIDKLTFDASNNIQTRVNDAGILNNISTGDVAIAIWNAITTDHVTPGTFGDAIRRTLGLSKQNIRIINQVFDNAGRLVSSTIRIFENATDLENNANYIAEYKMTATYDAQGKNTNYQVKES
ncbi:hypothetical protein AYK24_00285 [Thermoplasmatales archaeon SG8-52-4]|nr:MAG: hypothetical protein AYK24_00285 [Thermoplasmatales archaeon SG8-52-4]